MEDFEKIEFTAINPGLGLKEPQLVSEMAPETLEPPIRKPIQKRQAQHHEPVAVRAPSKILIAFTTLCKGILSFLMDHIFIALIYGLLLLFAYLQFQITTVEHLTRLLSDEIIFSIHVLLFVTLYGFYFIFFKQFKIPTLGKWIVFRES